jgi:hypothetical protein
MEKTEALAKSRDQIQYRERTDGPWSFSTSYHGSGYFVVDAKTRPMGHETPNAVMQVHLHLNRDELTTLADLIATALGGCLYLAGDDADSELR